jgi:hypothetical protein
LLDTQDHRAARLLRRHRDRHPRCAEDKAKGRARGVEADLTSKCGASSHTRFRRWMTQFLHGEACKLWILFGVREQRTRAAGWLWRVRVGLI